MYAYYLLTAMVGASAAPLVADKDPFQPEILVQAKCIRVEYPRGHRRWQTATFRVEYVYCGDAKLNGTTFEKTFILDYHALQNVLASMLHPPMREGEEGIWYLTRIVDEDTNEEAGLFAHVCNDGTHEENGVGVRSMAFPVPARKIIGQLDFSEGNHIHYPSALLWARIVEKVYKAKRADRLKMLRRYALSDNPYIAAWSLYVLTDYKPRDLIAFLEELAEKPNLSVAAQVVIDERLCALNWNEWHASRQRTAQLRRWVRGEIIDTRDVLMIAARINHAFQICAGDGTATPQMNWKTWLPLMEKWVVESDLSASFERRLYRMYQNVSRDTDRDKIFSYATNLLKCSKNVRRQRFAAKWLVQIRMTAKQRAIVKDLKDQTKDSSIRALLQEAIEDSKPLPVHR